MMRVILFGAGGMVGSGIAPVLKKQYSIITPTHHEIDVTNKDVVDHFIQKIHPDWIISCVGLPKVDEAQSNPTLAHLLNTKTARIISSCAKKIPFCYISTDAVFDGMQKSLAYRETDTPHPINIYGKTKLEGESYASLVVRIIMPYSFYFEKKSDFARSIVSALQNGQRYAGISDQIVNPISIDDAANALSILLSNQASGIYHLGATDTVSNLEFAKKIARAFDLPETRIYPITHEIFMKGKIAPRGKYCALDTEKFQKEFGVGILHTIDEGIRKFRAQFFS